LDDIGVFSKNKTRFSLIKSEQNAHKFRVKYAKYGYVCVYFEKIFPLTTFEEKR